MPVIKASDADVMEIIEKEPKVLVKFYADWCGSCKLISPKYNRIAEDPAFQNIKFLDVNAEENPAIRKRAGVTNLPFFAAFAGGELKEADFSAKEEFIKHLAVSLLDN